MKLFFNVKEMHEKCIKHTAYLYRKGYYNDKILTPLGFLFKENATFLLTSGIFKIENAMYVWNPAKVEVKDKKGRISFIGQKTKYEFQMYNPTANLLRKLGFFENEIEDNTVIAQLRNMINPSIDVRRYISTKVKSENFENLKLSKEDIEHCLHHFQLVDAESMFNYTQENYG